MNLANPDPIIDEVSYCVDPDWMPYEAIRNGKHVGISADYIREIEKNSGLTFKLVKTETWQESLDSLKRGDCEVASLLNKTPERTQYLNFTDAFFDGTNVFVSKDKFHVLPGYENIGDKLIGVVRSYRHAEYIARYYPELNVKLVENENDGLMLLANDEIDVFVGSILSVSAYIQRFGLRELKIVGLASPQDKLSVGVIKGRPKLLSVLNNAVNSIPEATHVEIFRQWNNVKIIDQVNYRYLWLIFALFLLVTFLFGLRNRYVTRFNRQLMVKTEMLEALQDELLEKNETLQFLSTHDQLTSLHNRHFMINRCEDEILRMNRFDQSACLILFDIDHFKPINDTYGHSAGDEVLKELTGIIKQEIREIDVSSRWGGEEFLVLCPQTSLSDAKALASRLSKAICQQTFYKVGKLTCSFGIAEYFGNQSFIQWFDRADVALYEAKAGGRNKIVMSD